MRSNAIVAQMSFAIRYELESSWVRFCFRYSTKSVLLRLYLKLLNIFLVTERNLIVFSSIQRFKGQAAHKVMFLFRK